MSKLKIIWLRNITVILVVAVVVGLGSLSWRTYTNLEKVLTVDSRIIELGGLLVYLDEVLTMSARMAVTSGDLAWEQRYLSFVVELDDAIAELQNIATAASSEFAAQTDGANAVLVEMEGRAFDLLRAGQQQQAEALLFSDAYESQKSQYTAGMIQFSARLSEQREVSLSGQLNIGLVGFAGLLLASLVLAILGIAHSRALRRQLSQDLNQSKSHYQMLFEQHPSAITVYQDNKIVMVNPTAVALMAADSEADLLGESPLKFIHPDFHALVQERISRANQGFINTPFQEKIIALDGSIHDVEVTSIPCAFNGKDATETLLRDMTEQLKAERSLKVSEEHYRRLFENMQDIYFETNVDGRIINISPSVEKLGYKREELLGKDTLAFYADPAMRRQMLSTLQERGSVDDFKMELFAKDGTKLNYSVSARIKTDTQSGTSIIVGALRDINERVVAEKLLRASEERLLVAQDLARLFWWEFDLETLSWSIPDELRHSLDGVSDGSLDDFQRLLAITHEDDRELVKESLRRVIEDNSEEEITYRLLIDGGFRWYHTMARLQVDKESKAVKVFGTSRNITLEKQAELERQQFSEQRHIAQKWESIATLAGGIAHDFNNVLTGILGQVDLLKTKAPSESELQSGLQYVIDYSIRASHLASQMLALSGKGSFVVEGVHLNIVLDSMADTLNAAISDNISLKFEHQAGLKTIEADQVQLQHLMTNLLSNAAESFPASKGEIHITTSNMIADEALLASAVNKDKLEPGNYVALKIVDRGCGMSPELLSKAFDPFVTTGYKSRGLGLSTTLGIVKAHKGALIAKSTVGEGTSITILFPAITAEKIIQEPLPRSTVRAARNTILVVDDELMIRELTENVLRSEGYEVVLASDGIEGVELFQQHVEELAVVLLDLTMPRMGGAEAYQKFQKIDDKVPVIICSGYAEGDLEKECFRNTDSVNFLHKPYRIDQLMRMVESIGKEEKNI